jgi:vancomycin permeability regulator SanA
LSVTLVRIFLLTLKGIVISFSVAILCALLFIFIAGFYDRIAPVDFGVVLGNTVDHSGKPSLRLQARIDRSIELYRKGLLKQIVVSGATGKEGFNEGMVMRDYLLSKDIPSQVIIADTMGADTYETARFMRHLCPDRDCSVMVITQFYHVPRSRYALSRFGFTDIKNAHAHYYELRDGFSVFREVAAFFKYGLRSYD